MADYMYLLENRLSADQQRALVAVREVARAQGATLFLVGGAVRDLTSGSPVRDLDVAVQGNALQLRGAIESAGGVIVGELKAARSLFALFPGGVRIEIGSTLSANYPKPGKPVYEAATILDDLRRRDFTVNAMALSLNEGSYGLLMDPLNGVADLENRQLRLVSNYGFIEDPARMVRAARFAARLGWTMDEKTQARYETGKAENYIKAMDAAHRGYETEEIFHEEDPLRVLRKLEEEGWMKHLFPALTVAKANAAELEKLREALTQLQMRGIHPGAAAANFPLLTAKVSAAEVAELKKSFVRPGFVAEIEALEGEAKEFAAQLNGKNAALPSQSWKLLTTAKPEAVLWVAYSTKNPAIQAKLKSFYTEWPKFRQKVPYALMQEMRIVPELEGFDEIVEKLFYELMDGNLGTVEEMKAWLEEYSPPAPPPPVNLRKARGSKKDAKGARSRKKATEDEGDGESELPAVAAEVEVEGAEADEVESEEEATEVMPLRGPGPPRREPEAEPELRKAAETEEIAEPLVEAKTPEATVPAIDTATVEPAPFVEARSTPVNLPVAEAALPAPDLPSPVKVPRPAKAKKPLSPAVPVTKAVSAPERTKAVPVPAKKASPAKKAAPLSAAPPAKTVSKAATTAIKVAAVKAVPPAKATAAKKSSAASPAAAKKTVAAKAKAPTVIKTAAGKAAVKAVPAKKAVSAKTTSPAKSVPSVKGSAKSSSRR